MKAKITMAMAILALIGGAGAARADGLSFRVGGRSGRGSCVCVSYRYTSGRSHHERRTAYRASPVPASRRSVHHRETRKPRVRRVEEHGRRHRPPVRCEPSRYHVGHGPILRYVSRHRRLMQPRVHGHPAVIQHYDAWRRRWVTVARHPSIW